MTQRKSLGEFETLLLLAVLRLGEEAYGVTIRREVEERTGREVTLGSIYPTMERLESKGLVASRMSEPTTERGGRSRRYFKVEPAGESALERVRWEHQQMWDGVELGRSST